MEKIIRRILRIRQILSRNSLDLNVVNLFYSIRIGTTIFSLKKVQLFNWVGVVVNVG